MSEESIKVAEAIKKRKGLGIYLVFPEVVLEELSQIQSKDIPYINKVFIPKSQQENSVFDKVFKSLRSLWVNTYGLNALKYSKNIWNSSPYFSRI